MFEITCSEAAITMLWKVTSGRRQLRLVEGLVHVVAIRNAAVLVISIDVAQDRAQWRSRGSRSQYSSNATGDPV